MAHVFHVGQVVRTKPGQPLPVEGPIQDIIIPKGDLALLWGHGEPHYRIRDNVTGEYVQVTEGGLEAA